MAFVHRGRNPEKCIVPQYCINKAAATTIERPKGHGSEKDRAQGDKSLARLWWDEIFTTCIGRMMIHSHRNMHPGQFRSFSAREYARAQGFPDWYKICGSALHYCNKRYDNPDTLVPLNKFQQIGPCRSLPTVYSQSSVAIIVHQCGLDRSCVAALLT